MRPETRGYLCAWVLFSVLGPALSLGAQNIPPQVLHYPDLVLLNGQVLTADDLFTVAEAVAIRDGKFLAVGANSAIRPLIGPDTEVIDLGGKTAIPGIINTHLHLADNAVRPIQWWRNDQEVLEGLKEQVPAVPEGQWVVRWFNSVVQGRIRGKLSKAQLDAIAPRHPLAVGSHTGGYYVLNSLAFQSLNLAEDLEGIGKDPQSGQPNGEVSGQAARYVGVQIGWVEPFEEKIDSLRRVIDGVISLGMTTIHTRINADGLTALREIWAADELKLRWRVAFTGFRGNEDFFKNIGNLTGIGDDMLRISGIAAGSADSFGGTGGLFTFRPKLRLNPLRDKDNPYGSTDSWSGSRKTMFEAVKYGWNVVGIHSEGDRATAEVLSDYEKATAARIVPSRDQTIRLDHLTMIRPREIQKMKELGIVPSVAAWHTFVPIKNLAYMYGPDAVAQMARARSFIDAGIELAAEVSSACPFWNIQRHVTRKDDQEGRVWGPEEKVTREEALKMHTNYAAGYFGEQDRLGTIEVGKLADLAVINGDYMTIPEDQIDKLTVSMVLVGGQIVFETDDPQPCTSQRYKLIREVTTFE